METQGPASLVKIEIDVAEDPSLSFSSTQEHLYASGDANTEMENIASLKMEKSSSSPPPQSHQQQQQQPAEDTFHSRHSFQIKLEPADSGDWPSATSSVSNQQDSVHGPNMGSSMNDYPRTDEDLEAKSNTDSLTPTDQLEKRSFQSGSFSLTLKIKSEEDQAQVKPSLDAPQGDNSEAEEEEMFEPPVYFGQEQKNVENKKRSQPGVKPHQCTECERKFTNVGSLRKHMLSHNGKRPHECKLCDAKFFQERALKTHMFHHSAEKPYECTLCEAKFNVKSSLKLHMLVHTDVKPYECSVCKATFKMKCALNRHALIHTGEKNFACTHCDAKFTTKHNLHEHLLKHTGEKPHACNYCEAKFRQKSTLNRHMMGHTGERPFKCILCGAGFRQNTQLTTHMTRHHEETQVECTG